MQTIQRMQGETGNPITGILSNRDDSLTIPEGTMVTVSGTRIDQGERIFTDSPVTITDYDTRAFSYAPADGAHDWDTPCTMRLLFKFEDASGKVTYIPDHTDYELRLQINPV
jgi:hypothetical protein